VLGGRFVEMTLRAGTSGDTWSAVFYIGFERTERRHVLPLPRVHPRYVIE
jgi:hypothetical protein